MPRRPFLQILILMKVLVMLKTILFLIIIKVMQDGVKTVITLLLITSTMAGTTGAGTVVLVGA